MPSSISSSETTPSWSRIWALALVLAAVALGSYESIWRARGVDSVYRDDRALWSLARSRLRSPDGWRGALVGSSRAQVDLDPDILAPVFGGTPPVVLAIRGAAPPPVLANLADEARYDGVVLYEVNPLHLFASSPEWDDVATDFVTHYIELPRIGAHEISLRLALREHMVSLNPQLAPHLVVRGLLAGSIESPQRLKVGSDRHARIDFSENAEMVRQQQTAYYDSKGMPIPIDDTIDRLVRDAAKLRSRGGEVVLLRLPSSGELRGIEARRFPRQRYWDLLVARSGLPAIHFEDYPSLRGFDCPDGSHLSATDAREFTRRLVPILETVLIQF